MELDLNMEKMKRFMQNFYITTGVRSAVYDSNYRKVIAYPEKNTGICQLMHENERMLMYGKEASNRKQEIDRQHHTIPNQRKQRPKDKHYGNVHNRLWNHG
ncbi:PocR ligand-binding domain-containing protein [uncultured Robinsoniella sp.]|uniref:PocR ligand-binding domain-containing protein n=1 Tax=uncultured Robinsoniella sp. TaxID=904190 RepID=UPI00374EF806